MGEYNKQMQRFNVGEDCPVFDGLYEFCQLSAGGSVASAVKLNKQVKVFEQQYLVRFFYSKQNKQIQSSFLTPFWKNTCIQIDTFNFFSYSDTGHLSGDSC